MSFMRIVTDVGFPLPYIWYTGYLGIAVSCTPPFFKRVRMLTLMMVPLHNDYMSQLYNYQCDIRYFLL